MKKHIVAFFALALGAVAASHVLAVGEPLPPAGSAGSQNAPPRTNDPTRPLTPGQSGNPNDPSAALETPPNTRPRPNDQMRTRQSSPTRRRLPERRPPIPMVSPTPASP